MSLSNYLENALLNHIRGSAYTVPAGLFVKLHTGDPGEDCVSSPAAEATRKAATFGPAVSGSMASTANVTWSGYGATETVSFFSIWDAITAGNPLGSGALTAAQSMTAGGTLTLTSGQLTWAMD